MVSLENGQFAAQSMGVGNPLIDQPHCTSQLGITLHVSENYVTTVIITIYRNLDRTAVTGSAVQSADSVSSLYTEILSNHKRS